MKVLITGFEPFGAWQRNPSGETARHLDGATIVDAEITGLVLPVSYKRAAAPVIAAIDELRPDVVLNLGQGLSIGVRVERLAVNRSTAPQGGDNDGYEPQGESIVPGGPETYTSTLPVAEIVDLLSGLKFETAASDSAGEFLCNYVMYTTLHHIATHQLPVRAGFIHASPLREEIPDLTDGKGMRLKRWIDFTESVIYLLRTMVVTQKDDVQKSDERLNRDAIDELKRYREEIRLAHPGQVFEDSVELLRQAREERTRELEQEPGY